MWYSAEVMAWLIYILPAAGVIYELLVQGLPVFVSK
jgi:hypothetical protein